MPRADLNQLQTRVALIITIHTNLVVDHNILLTGDHDTTSRTGGNQSCSTKGFDAALARQVQGAGAQDDVAIRLQVATNLKRTPCVNNDTGIGAASHQSALQDGIAGRVQLDIATAGFKGATGAQVKTIRAEVATAQEVDRVMADDMRRDDHVAIDGTLTAKIDH